MHTVGANLVVARSGVGKARPLRTAAPRLKALAYSAMNTAETGLNNKVFGDVDLRSLRPESSAPGVFLPYELPRRA